MFAMSMPRSLETIAHDLKALTAEEFAYRKPTDRGMERSERACRWSGSLAALQRSGVKRLELTESGSGGASASLEDFEA